MNRYNFFKPKTPVVGCKNCGCTLSRVRFVGGHWVTRFLDSNMPQWVWDMIPSRCRRCGDRGLDPWVDQQR